MITKNKYFLKKALLLLFAIFVSLYSNVHIYAATLSIPTARDYDLGSSGSGGGTVSEPTRPYWPYRSCEVGERLCYVEYKTNYNTNRIININAYDHKDRTIFPETFESNVKFKAGTWIGINLQEYKYASWNVTDPVYSEKVKLYKCNNTITDAGIRHNQDVEDCIAFCGTCPTAADIAAATERCTSPNPPEECSTMSIPEACAACITPGCGTPVTCEGSSEVTVPYYHNIATEENFCYGYYGRTLSEDAYCKDIPASPTSTGEKLIDLEEADLEEVAPKCGLEAVRTTASWALSYASTPTLQVEIIDPNDYDKDNMKIIKFTNNKLIKDEEELKTKLPDNRAEYINNITEENYTNYINMPQSIEYYATYEYSPDKVCIDIKTSKVAYNTTYNENECPLNTTDTSKIIKNTTTFDEYLNGRLGEEVEYWHYFIPLDTNTTTSDTDDVGFFIRLANTNDESLTNEQCITALERYPVIDGDVSELNYMEFITPVSPTGVGGLDFSGDYKRDDNANSMDMKLFRVYNYVCKISARIKFNIEQKFYGEEKGENDTLTIKGYGFYYRPINPNKPFPNPIATDSIWLNLYTNEHNENSIVVKNDDTVISTTRLNESFNEVTYTTANASIYDIRNMRAIDKIYTSWSTMNVNGRSNFISDYNMRTRDISQYNIYKIGCGPKKIDFFINSDEEVVCP